MVRGLRQAFLFLTLSIFGLLTACQDVGKADYLIAKSEAAVIGELGVPQREKMIVLEKGVKLHEYQSDLYRILERSGAEEISVKELQWNLKRKTIVAWLVMEDGDWKVRDTLVWTDNVRF